MCQRFFEVCLKRTLPVFVALLLVLALLSGLLIGCRQADAESEESSLPAESVEAAAFHSEDLWIQFESETFAMLADAEPLLDKLGEDFRYSEAESCVYEGMDKTFDYGAFIVYTIPSAAGDLLDGLDVLEGDLTTGKGIGLGSHRDEILTVYGPAAEEDQYLIYNASGKADQLGEPRLVFYLDEQAQVNLISYYSGSNAQK